MTRFLLEYPKALALSAQTPWSDRGSWALSPDIPVVSFGRLFIR